MKQTIALFDFDGTITISDSTNTFYRFLYKKKAHYVLNNYIYCLKHIFFLILKITNYLPLKKRRLHIHTSKYNNDELEMIIKVFYDEVFYKLINQKALNRICWHKEQGHEVWVISASYDFLLNRWATEHQLNLITNKTYTSFSKRFIKNKDVNFDAKIEYLTKQINLEDYSEIYAYGDSAGDLSMLSVADYKFYKPFRD